MSSAPAALGGFKVQGSLAGSCQKEIGTFGRGEAAEGRRFKAGSGSEIELPGAGLRPRLNERDLALGWWGGGGGGGRVGG